MNSFFSTLHVMNDFLSTNQQASWAKLLSYLVLFPTNNIADTEKFVRANHRLYTKDGHSLWVCDVKPAGGDSARTSGHIEVNGNRTFCLS